MYSHKQKMAISLGYAFESLAKFIGIDLILGFCGISNLSQLSNCGTITQWVDCLIEDKVQPKQIEAAIPKLRTCKYVPKYAELLEMCKPDYQLEFSRFLSHEANNDPTDIYLFNVSNHLFKSGVTKLNLMRDSAACFNAFKKAVDHVISLSDEQLISLPVKTLKLEVDASLNVEALAKEKLKKLENAIRAKITVYNFQRNSDINDSLAVMQYLFKHMNEPQTLIQKVAEVIIFEFLNQGAIK
jgi:hypothetical protein